MGPKMTTQEPEFFLKTADDVVTYLADWKRQKGRLRVDKHLWRDRANRNVTDRDCEYVLTTATVNSLQWPPVWNAKHQNHVLRIDSFDLDGEAVSLLFVIDSENFRIVVFNWLA
jgi:hypothetical protein